MAFLFKIQIDDENGNSRNYNFDQDKVIIGRDPTSDIVVDDIEISRKHLVLFRENESFFVEDNNSTNGTFINKKQLTKKTQIKSGEKLVLGKSHILKLEIIKPEPIIEEEHDINADVNAEITQPPEEESPESVPVQTEEKIEVSNEVNDVPAPDKKITRKKKSKIKPNKKPMKKLTIEGRPKWLVILLAILAFIIIFCVIPLIVIEVTNQWCDLFAGFFNSLSPGVCP